MISTLHARFQSSGFYLWEHQKILVYTAHIDNEEALHHRTVDACQIIRNYPDIFVRMLRSMMTRVEACIFLMDDISSAYYKCTLSATTHVLHFSGSMFLWTFFIVLVCGTRARTLSAPFSYTVFIVSY
jgi:hypothetical protein